MLSTVRLWACRDGGIQSMQGAVALMAYRVGRDRLTDLRNDLAVVVSAEALFTLVDLKSLAPDAAVASVTAAAHRLVAETVADLTQ